MSPLNSVVADVAALLLPPRRIPLSKWADAHMVLSSEASAAPGPWRCLPYQREPLDAMSVHSPHDEIVLKFASQTGKTSLMLAFLAQMIAEDPGPMLVVLPTLTVCEAFSKDRLAPLFRDCPALRGRVADPKSREAGSTIFHRQFVGGHLTIVSSNSAAGLSSRPIRYLLLDEVDRFLPSAGAEGNPSDLARARQRAFWNRKLIRSSSPTVEGSEIDTACAASDQRRYHVPCPLCGVYQVLAWPRVEWPEGMPEEAAYRCAHCEGLIHHHRKYWMVERGEWVAENPSSPIPGFWLPEQYSLTRSWGDMAVDWLRAQGNPEKTRAFVNTSLALNYDEEATGNVTERELLARVENYGPLLPERVAILTAGVDVQADRAEVSVYGWGAGEESWLMVHRIIPGDPTGPGLWSAVDEFLRDQWQHPIVGPMPVHAAAIDSGAFTSAVCRFCDERRGRRVWAIKAAPGPRPPWPRRQSRATKGAVYVIGADSLRTTVAGRLKLTGGPGTMHFPSTVGMSYFEQLCSEFVSTEYRRGRPVRSWVRRKGRRAEAWDAAVYALAALAGLASHGISVDVEASKIEAMRNAGIVPGAGYQVARSRFIGR
ncbi:MAG: terminase gpA endonuclease subunit [Bryobacteraceae bacterium]